MLFTLSLSLSPSLILSRSKHATGARLMINVEMGLGRWLMAVTWGGLDGGSVGLGRWVNLMGLYPMGRDHRVVEIDVVRGFWSAWFVGFDRVVRGFWLSSGFCMVGLWILDSDWLVWVGVVMVCWWCGGGDCGGWLREREIEIRKRSENIFILFLFYFILF